MDQATPPMQSITERPTINEMMDYAAEQRSLSWIWLVEDFQTLRLKNHIPSCPTWPENKDLMNTCLGFLQEEVDEIEVAIGDKDLPGVVDGLVDLIYYAIGLAVQLGVDLEPHFHEVHLANMEKVHNPEAEPGKEKRVTKPESWKSPRTKEMLNKQGRVQSF